MTNGRPNEPGNDDEETLEDTLTNYWLEEMEDDE